MASAKLRKTRCLTLSRREVSSIEPRFGAIVRSFSSFRARHHPRSVRERDPTRPGGMSPDRSDRPRTRGQGCRPRDVRMLHDFFTPSLQRQEPFQTVGLVSAYGGVYEGQLSIVLVPAEGLG